MSKTHRPQRTSSAPAPTLALVPAPAPVPVPAEPPKKPPAPSVRDRSIEAGATVKKMRSGTKQAHVLNLMVEGNLPQVIANQVGISIKEVRHHFINLAAKGIGRTTKEGVVKAVLPEGVALEDCFIE